MTFLLATLLAASSGGGAAAQGTVTLTIVRQQPTSGQRSRRPLPSAVLWLMPLDNQPADLLRSSDSAYTLQQKNRTFTPHVLVVPAGATVTFPNLDPFFHNVFSLYNGKRFDLGLYEKGTSRQVVFNREGVSYIFCNIHPEMSAVVLALRTTWWAQSDDNGLARIDGLPPGYYDAHLWVEGVDPRQLLRWTHRVHIVNGVQNLGSLTVDPEAIRLEHTNKFGVPYLPDARPY